MRGCTFKRCFIIADEMQNSSPSQMKTLLTRLGKGSRIVITGDLTQTDRDGRNGLGDFLERLQRYPVGNVHLSLIKYVKFDNIDIQRSEVVSQILLLVYTMKVLSILDHSS